MTSLQTQMRRAASTWCVLGGLILLSLVASCPLSGTRNSTFYRGAANITAYAIRPQRVTPKGIAIDDARGLVTDHHIDKATDDVEACLRTLPSTWTDEQMRQGHCLDKAIPREIRRDKIAVKIPEDFYFSECTGEQLFPCNINPKLCDAKPELDGITCPCACRATIQDNRTIVTTPILKLYPAELVRLVTGCNYVWFQPLSTCAKSPIP